MGKTDCSSVAGQWAGLWEGLADPRKARGKRHGWPTILTLLTWGIGRGCTSVAAIGEMVQHQADDIRYALGLGEQRLPGTDTLRRALRMLEVESLEALSARLAQKPMPDCSGAEALRGQSVDGKAVRGAGRHGKPLCVVGRVEHETGRVLDQVEVDHKSNEITAVPVLLARSPDKNVVITMDALLTQREIANQILEADSHYLMMAKDNQPRLLTSIAAHFLDAAPTLAIQSHRTMEKGHGRIEFRVLEATAAPQAWVSWPGAQQVLRRTCTRTDQKSGKTTVCVSYGLTSLPPTTATPADLERLWRQHWTIENKTHYVRDVSMGEDACQVRAANAPRALTIFRNLVLNALRAGSWPSIPAAQRALAASVPFALSFLAAALSGQPNPT
jgi:predicted transposase YbfD/YdcC